MASVRRRGAPGTSSGSSCPVPSFPGVGRVCDPHEVLVPARAELLPVVGFTRDQQGPRHSHGNPRQPPRGNTRWPGQWAREAGPQGVLLRVRSGPAVGSPGRSRVRPGAAQTEVAPWWWQPPLPSPRPAPSWAESPTGTQSCGALTSRRTRKLGLGRPPGRWRGRRAHGVTPWLRCVVSRHGRVDFSAQRPQSRVSAQRQPGTWVSWACKRAQDTEGAAPPCDPRSGLFSVEDFVCRERARARERGKHRWVGCLS